MKTSTVVVLAAVAAATGYGVYRYRTATTDTSKQDFDAGAKRGTIDGKADGLAKAAKKAHPATYSANATRQANYEKGYASTYSSTYDQASLGGVLPLGGGPLIGPSPVSAFGGGVVKPGAAPGFIAVVLPTSPTDPLSALPDDPPGSGLQSTIRTAMAGDKSQSLYDILPILAGHTEWTSAWTAVKARADELKKAEDELKKAEDEAAARPNLTIEELSEPLRSTTKAKLALTPSWDTGGRDIEFDLYDRGYTRAAIQVSVMIPHPGGWTEAQYIAKYGEPSTGGVIVSGGNPMLGVYGFPAVRQAMAFQNAGTMSAQQQLALVTDARRTQQQQGKK